MRVLPPFSFTDSDGSGTVEAERLILGVEGPASSFSDMIAGRSDMTEALVFIEDGDPVSYDGKGNRLARDSDAGAVLQAAIDEVSSTAGRAE